MFLTFSFRSPRVFLTFSTRSHRVLQILLTFSSRSPPSRSLHVSHTSPPRSPHVLLTRSSLSPHVLLTLPPPHVLLTFSSLPLTFSAHSHIVLLTRSSSYPRVHPTSSVCSPTLSSHCRRVILTSPHRRLLTSPSRSLIISWRSPDVLLTSSYVLIAFNSPPHHLLLTCSSHPQLFRMCACCSPTFLLTSVCLLRIVTTRSPRRPHVLLTPPSKAPQCFQSFS